MLHQQATTATTTTMAASVSSAQRSPSSSSSATQTTARCRLPTAAATLLLLMASTTTMTMTVTSFTPMSITRSHRLIDGPVDATSVPTSASSSSMTMVSMASIPSSIRNHSRQPPPLPPTLLSRQQQQQQQRLRQRLPQEMARQLVLNVATSEDVLTTDNLNENMPELSSNGIYQIQTGEQHQALLAAYPDQLIVMKVFAPWCRACKGLEPKFNAIVKDEKYKALPIIWADFTIQHNKAYIKTIGVLALPTVQFYVNAQRMDTFPCGPSKVPILKRKLAQLVNDYIDPDTLLVRPMTALGSVVDLSANDAAENVLLVADAAAPAAAVTTSSTAPPLPQQQQQQQQQSSSSSSSTDDPNSLAKLLQRNKSKLRSIPYFSGMLESQFEGILAKANLLTFDSGNIIMREGNKGRTFYYILQGEVEICQKTSFEDPLTTPPAYLGTVINRFEAEEYFGERALITGEPRAASIRASTRTVCLAFDREDFPVDCVLSGKDVSRKEEGMADMNERYGVAMYDMTAMNDQQYLSAVQANQVRGSVNRPRVIDGVDNDMEIAEELMKAQQQQQQQQQEASATGEKMGDYDSSTAAAAVSGGMGGTMGADPETIVPLLLRFKLIRLVTRCFDYIVKNRLTFGDDGGRKRRRILVNLLSIGQQAEIRDAYNLIDADADGEITLMELRRLMDSVGESRSDEELVDLIETSHRSMADGGVDDGKQVITYQDFFGIMAEVEFYHLFLETFRALDERDSGFVSAKDLDRVLVGMRDLVTDDRRSIIDVEDTEMMVDYEQFSRMLLGTALT